MLGGFPKRYISFFILLHKYMENKILTQIIQDTVEWYNVYPLQFMFLE